MKLGLRLLLLTLLVVTTLAASRCGKKSRQSKYGKPANFRSVAGVILKCKYRIRSSPGFHIKLVLENYHPDPCCLKVSILPKRTSRSRKAQMVEIPPGPRATLVVNASDIIVLVKTTSTSAEAVTINHEAVIPSDGDFGFDFQASRKPKLIRSPGFPKIKLPSGVRSVWNVTSRRGEVIRIDITGFSTADGQDTLQIFDGPTAVGEVSGRKKRAQLPITKHASSGNMVIILETQTATSKGFKAKIHAAESDDGEAGMPGGSSEALQCHKRLRMSSRGATITDEHSQMTCDDGEICGTMIVEGSSGVSGLILPVRSETTHCIPSSLCGRGCGEVSRREKSITVNSCNLTCCNTPLCNSLPDAPPTSSGGAPAPTLPALQCHKRFRILSSGTTISDEHSQMTCDDGQICGTMIVEGSSTVGGLTLPVRSETTHCIPPSLCGGGCGKISRRDKSIAVTSCNLTCCNTALCNTLPDGPPISSGSSAAPPIWPLPGHTGGLRCSEQSEVTRGSGMGLGAASSGNTCPSDSVCALYVFSGVSDDSDQEKVVGYVAKCTPEANCDEDGCSALYETRDVNVTSCNVTCCREDNCNDPQQAVIPTLPPPEPVAHYCYYVERLHLEGETRKDISLHSPCHNPEDRCLRVDAYITNRDGQNGVAAAGKCIPKLSCSNLDCASLLELDDGVTATSCVATCCSNDFCNEMPLTIPPPTGTTGLWCHKKNALVQEGAVMQSPDQNTLCDEGDVCAVFKFYGNSTEPHQIEEPMAGYAALCQPSAACNEDACSTLPGTDNIAVSSCEATCCRTNMCNDPGEPPMPSPRPPATGHVNRCYNIQQSLLASGTYLTNSKLKVSCNPDSACIRTEAALTMYGMDVSVVYGACVPSISCRAVTCDSVASTLPGKATIQDCKIQCCETDLCNEEPITDETSTSRPTILSSSVSSSTAGSVNQCYSILKATMSGISLLNQESVRSCDPNSVCLRIEAVARRPGFGGTIAITHGICYPKVSCGAATSRCDLATRSVPGVTIEQCRAHCCETELCNKNPLSEMSVPTTPPVPPSTSDSISGGSSVPETTRCYNIFEVKTYGMQLPGAKKDIMPCPPGSQCIKILSTSYNPSYPEVTARTTVGYCLPRAVCATMDCTALPQAPGMPTRTCTTECCDGDLCNG